MHREDLKRICEYRIKEAKILYENGRFDGAYYLLGYALECSIKCCISRQIKEHTIPDRKLINDFYQHDLNKLMSLSGVKQKFDDACNADIDLKLNWAVATNWSEQKRYKHGLSWRETKDFFEAVHDKNSGVLQWIKNWW